MPQTTFVLFMASVIAAEPTEDQKNAKIQAELAAKVYLGIMRLHDTSPTDQPWDIEKFSLWSRRVASAQRDASEKKEDRVKAIQAHVDRMKDLERVAKSKVKGNFLPRFEAAAAEYHRREAEKWLAKEKAKN